MSVVPEGYKGREHSYVKHQFLTQYLQSAAYKILQGRSPVFNYVDAFAGPWQYTEGSELSDTSFHRAVQRLETVRSDLERRGIENLSVRPFFCEKRKRAVEQLREYAKQHSSLRIRVYGGKFEDNLHAIEEACREGFTFTFIDPTGWNIASDVVFDFLVRLNGEFLLNFMAEPIDRHATYSKVTASIGRFLADPDWEGDFARCARGGSNEEKVLRLLKTKMKERRVATYLPDMAIKRPRQERIKMRLVLGTHSPIGVDVFRDVQEKVEKMAMGIRSDIKRGVGFRTLFASNDELIAMQQEHEGVGSPSSLRQAERLIVGWLQQTDGIPFGQLAPRVMEEVPIRKTQLNTLMGKMKEQGVVCFDLPERARVPRPGTRIWLA